MVDLEEIKEKTKKGFEYVIDRTQNLIGKYTKKFDFVFKRENPVLEKRRKQSEELLRKYPEKIPVILEKDPNCKISEIKKKKFLCPIRQSISHFNAIIRGIAELDPTEALFLLINGNNSIIGDVTMGEIYEKNKDEDGFLYIVYSSELAWGKI
jgi:GABA(A) receptor-associated protein